MILDAKLELSSAQALASVGTHASTNVINFGTGYDEFGDTAQRNPGEGGQMWLNVQVETAFTSVGAGTLSIKLQDSADNATFADVYTGETWALASLTAGAKLLRMPLPADLRQYVRLLYTVGTTAMTAGKVDAWIGPGTEGAK